MLVARALLLPLEGLGGGLGDDYSTPDSPASPDSLLRTSLDSSSPSSEITIGEPDGMTAARRLGGGAATGLELGIFLLRELDAA